MVPGERAVSELLQAAPQRVHKLILVEDRKLDPSVWAICQTQNIPVETCSKAQISEMLDPRLARGVIAMAQPPPTYSLEKLLLRKNESEQTEQNTVIVAVDGVQDPQNLGAIIRSAEFFGAVGVLWAKDRSANYSPALIRASAGASERLPLVVVNNLARALETCKRAGFWCVGTVVHTGTPLFQLCKQDLPASLVLVLGSEKSGIRRLTREHCDFLVTIPGAGKVGSLNVSAAAAVVLSAMTRKTGEG